MSFDLVTLLTGLSSASALFLVASGLSIIFGVTRIVNFAHGSFYMLGAYIGYTLILQLGDTSFGFWGAILIAAVAVGLVGVIMEVTLLRRIYQAPELFQLIATFGVILVIQDVAQWIWGNEDKVGRDAPGLDGSVTIGGRLLPTYDLALIAAAILVLAGLWLLFNKTRWGTMVRAATQDRQMVAALGVDQRWLFTGVLFLGSALAGLGGAIQVPKGGADLLMDFGILAEAFVVVVVGGMGSITGAFLAAMIIGLLGTLGIQVLPNSTLVLMFAVMALVLVFRPYGLLGKQETGPQGQPGPPEAPLRKSLPAVRGVALVVLAIVVLLPVVHVIAPGIVGDFTLVLGIEILIFVLFAAALHFIMGPGGMVSFGHAAYFGGGAYAVALAVKYLDPPFELVFWAAPLGGALLALIFGWFCVRLSGVYFAMLTLAFAQIAWAIVFQDMPTSVARIFADPMAPPPDPITGGDDGILNVWPARWASPRIAYYYLTAVMVIGSLVLLRAAAYAPFGQALRAGRDSPLRAAAIGIDLKRHQWAAFVLSGAMAGLAGSLFVFSKGSVFPTAMEIARSFDALLMVLLGGVQSLFGPIIGAATFTWLADAFSRLEYWRFLMGMTIIALVIVLPQGLSGFAQTSLGRRLGLSRGEEAEPEVPAKLEARA